MGRLFLAMAGLNVGHRRGAPRLVQVGTGGLGLRSCWRPFLCCADCSDGAPHHRGIRFSTAARPRGIDFDSGHSGPVLYCIAGCRVGPVLDAVRGVAQCCVVAVPVLFPWVCRAGVQDNHGAHAGTPVPARTSIDEADQESLASHGESGGALRVRWGWLGRHTVRRAVRRFLGGGVCRIAGDRVLVPGSGSVPGSALRLPSVDGAAAPHRELY
mmetsp:Transcript_13301/g.33247  ORF Transcript_13301/g.33247 Transcript_13301/m.33247 type:complete len:213 (-) Transcript_13301:1467-2105(-)